MRSPIPAGTGLREYEKIIVGSRDEYEKMLDARKNVTDIAQNSDLDEVE